MLRTSLTLIATIALAPATLAAGSAQWTGHDATVREACFKVSGLSRPDTESRVFPLPGQAGKEALLIDGDDTSYGRDSDMLCVFDRATSIASVGEIADDD